MNLRLGHQTMTKLNQQPEWHLVILGMALFLGAVVRIMPPILARFPINDGGMFYVMVKDLSANSYRLPPFTTYNLADIPYAYPPFGFYVAALFSGLLHFSIIEVLRWLPALVHITSIYAFYLTASAILRDKSRGALAAVLYAVAPGSYGWFIMGGGLTRAFGGLFLLLSVYFLYRVFERGEWRAVIYATVMCALAVLSHPEAGLHTAGTCTLAWIFWGRTRRRSLQALMIAFGAVLLTAPWWVSILAGHGTGPVISALHTGLYGSSPLSAFARDFFTLGSIIPILTVLRIAGLICILWKRQFFLAAWSLLPYFVEPRSAPAVSFYPFTMLAALGLADAVPALIRILRRQPVEEPVARFSEIKWMNPIVLLIVGYLFIGSALYTFPLVNTTLTAAERQTMAWVRENTAADAHFLLLTGGRDAMVDPVQEWFPALAERRSQTTLQGYEWTLAARFSVRWDELSTLQGCGTAACVEKWSSDTGLDFNYLLVERKGMPEGLPASLENAGYKLIDQNQQISIFRK